MRSDARSHNDASQGKECRVGRFIQQHLDLTAYDGPQSFLLVMQSASSPVARALSALSAEIVLRSVDLRVIVAGDQHGLDPWLQGRAGTHAPLARELRIARNRTLLDAHEQLVLGQRAVWFGDSMRRDPQKRDAYENFLADDPAAARLARSTFERLWQATQPLPIGRLETTFAAA